MGGVNQKRKRSTSLEISNEKVTKVNPNNIYTMAIKQGQLIKLSYETREFEVIVIDPNGLGEGKPTVGMGLRMIEFYMGIPGTTLSDWVKQARRSNHPMSLKLPSGKLLRVIEITSEANNNLFVVEASQWTELATDLLANPGKTRKETLTKVTNFLVWFTSIDFQNCLAKAVIEKTNKNLMTNKIIRAKRIATEPSLFAKRLKPRSVKRKSLYVLGNELTNLLKIGVSNDINRRKKEIELLSGTKLKVLYLSPSLDNAFYVERRLHVQFSNYRTVGEWFNVDASKIVEFALSLINPR